MHSEIKNKMEVYYSQPGKKRLYIRPKMIIQKKFLVTILFLDCLMFTGYAETAESWSIIQRGTTFIIQAGNLQRIIQTEGTGIITTSFKIGSHDILKNPAADIELRLSRANPNKRLRRVEVMDETQAVQSTTTFGQTDALKINESIFSFDNGVQWVEETFLTSGDWISDFDLITAVISKPEEGVTRLTLRVRSTQLNEFKDVSVALHYEVYEGYPAIRQWAEVVNNSQIWYRLDQLMLSSLPIGEVLSSSIALTPDDKAVEASIRSFSNQGGDYGLILGSEVPSATRVLNVHSGKMGYSESYFEWIIGPSNRFVSEAISYFGYQGKVIETLSAVSTPLDRCVERTYKNFLSKIIGVVADHADLMAPRYCTWSNYGEFITEDIARKIIPIAARCGFNTFQIDDGWQYDRLGTEPDETKFPQFEEMCRMVVAENMNVGLWVSCFRSPDSKDLQVLPDALSLPPIKRLSGYGMGFASDWRYYYAQDLIYLRDRYNAKYFKQDFTNIRLGDLAASHESNSRKESYLRALRGLLESQLLVREISPDITTLISHEIYWGTPGVPCDLAVMKHVGLYHIPPNDYLGLGGNKYRKSLVAEYDSLCDRENVREDLLKACWNARQRYFAHRGLPLHMLEYYGAATANVQNALTSEIQDRQICSFLMGAPVVYAGDLLSLTEKNIQHYRKRFDLLKNLQEKYNIYRHFQFSGVPEPTDEKWHWWGKLNEDGCGAVIILRGSKGSDLHRINIPWVKTDENYRLKCLFSDNILGEFSGRQLQEGAIELELPNWGQEIIEIAKVE